MFNINSFFASPMNLPTETDDFETERNELSESNRNDGRKKHLESLREKDQNGQNCQNSQNSQNSQTKLPRSTSKDQNNANNTYPSDTDRVFNFDDLREKFANKLHQTEEFLQNPLHLPETVKFPHKFRESARNFYVKTRDSNKLPKTVRLYRERLLKHNSSNVGSQNGPTDRITPEPTNELSDRLSPLTPAKTGKNSLETAAVADLQNQISHTSYARELSRSEIELDDPTRTVDQFIQDRSVDFLFHPYGMSLIFTVIGGIFYLGMTRKSVMPVKQLTQWSTFTKVSD